MNSGVLLFLGVIALKILRKMARIEHLLGVLQSSAREDAAESATEPSRGSAFEEFLNESPQRKLLTKGEQFAAYRQWRKEKGMNWSK